MEASIDYCLFFLDFDLTYSGVVGEIGEFLVSTN